ncbi:hypothetical protein M5Z94_02420 [Oceanotoga teriensis]|jgi:hypothetical protein|nr:hypothetical protein [Oceanotoga teriensis]
MIEKIMNIKEILIIFLAVFENSKLSMNLYLENNIYIANKYKNKSVKENINSSEK